MPARAADGGEQSLVLAPLGVEQRRIQRLPGVGRVGGDVGEDAGSHVGHVLELHAAQVDPRFLLELVHHRVAEALLVDEVAVDRALVDPRLLSDGADGQAVPVLYRRAVQQLGPGGDDARPGLGRPLAPQGAVVRPAGRSPVPAGRLRVSVTGHGRHVHQASLTDQPPSTGMTAPVTKDARSEARKAPTSATSVRLAGSIQRGLGGNVGNEILGTLAP